MSASDPRGRDRRFKGCCIGCSSTVVLLLLVLMVRWMIGTRAVVIAIPLKIPPSPNGFDSFKAAAFQLVNSNAISNAAGPEAEYTLAQKQALVKSNAAPLAKLRSALSLAYMDTCPRSFDAVIKYYAGFREMARLLSLDAQIKEQQHDWNGSVSSGLDCIRMGVSIPHGAPVIGCLVGIACQAIGRKGIWSCIDHLTATQCRAAAARLADMMNDEVSFADVLTEERYMSISVLQQVFNSKETINGFGPPIGGPGAGSLFFLIYSKQRIARDNQAYYDRIIANARKPYGLHLPEEKVPSDPVNQTFLGEFQGARFSVVETETQNRLLLLKLLLRAYRLEHGSYPASLSALVPGSLPSVPTDPFGVGAPLLYRPAGDAFLLYSVGPDGKDDGGKPIDDPSKRGSRNLKERYIVLRDSKGDVVAGINTQ